MVWLPLISYTASFIYANSVIYIQYIQWNTMYLCWVLIHLNIIHLLQSNGKHSGVSVLLYNIRYFALFHAVIRDQWQIEDYIV